MNGYKLIRKPSEYWRYVEIKGKWVKITEELHIWNGVCGRLFGVALVNGKVLSREDFNLLPCLQGEEDGLTIWKPSVLKFI